MSEFTWCPNLLDFTLYWPWHEKTCLKCLRPDKTRVWLQSYRVLLSKVLIFRISADETLYTSRILFSVRTTKVRRCVRGLRICCSQTPKQGFSCVFHFAHWLLSNLAIVAYHCCAFRGYPFHTYYRS